MDGYILNSTESRWTSGVGLASRLYWAGVAFFSLTSLVLFLINTRYGIGIYPDSLRYMGISERPYDAPLYAWLLMGVSATGVDLPVGAKAIGLFFVCANTILIWHLLVRASGKYVYATAGTAIITLAPQFVTLHSLAMSEPPFLFFLLVTVLALLRYFETEDRTWLKASAVLLGLTTLVRFTAPPLGAAIAVCLLLDPRHTLSRRFVDATIFAVVSTAIFLCWVVMSEVIADRSIGRALWFYGNMGASEWLKSLGAMTAWLLPDKVPFAARVVLLGAFAAAAAYLTFLHAREPRRHARQAKVADALLPTLFGLFFFLYLGFMVLSTSVEANLSLTGRYAFPVYVTTVLMITIVLAHIGDARGIVKLVHYGLVCFAVLVFGGHVVRTAARSSEAYRFGVGYASREWVNSPTMQALRQLPADASIYSNGADVVAYVLGRESHFLPERIQLRTGRDNPANPYERQLRTLHDDLTKEHSYVAIFDAIDWRFYLVSEAELNRRLSLVKVATEADGRIYAMPKTTR